MTPAERTRIDIAVRRASAPDVTAAWATCQHDNRRARHAYRGRDAQLADEMRRAEDAIDAAEHARQQTSACR